MKSTIACTCLAIEARARSVNSSGFCSAYSAQSSSAMPSGRYDSGSCALVWSVTTSIGTPRRSSSGKTSAALPTTPTDQARRSALAFRAISTAASRLSATSSR